jgi:cytoskeletal protein CcmA (bactofilin family)
MASLSSIGPTTAVRGNVRGEGDLTILGRVEGSVVVTGDVTVGEGALIQSDVRGRRVTVHGAIAGNVSGDEAVILEPGARVVGDLGAPQIGIRPGALVRGNVSTGAPLPEAAPARAEAAPARAPAASARPAAAPAAPSTPAPPARPRVAEPRTPAPLAASAAPPARPAVRPAPAPIAPRPTPTAAPRPAPASAESSQPANHEPSEEAEAAAGGPPPPVVPAIRKGAKVSMRRKGGAR